MKMMMRNVLDKWQRWLVSQALLGIDWKINFWKHQSGNARLQFYSTLTWVSVLLLLLLFLDEDWRGGGGGDARGGGGDGGGGRRGRRARARWQRVVVLQHLGIVKMMKHHPNNNMTIIENVMILPAMRAFLPRNQGSLGWTSPLRRKYTFEKYTLVFV